MMSRLGFCCDHECGQASAINIAAGREMRLIHRAIRSPEIFGCRVLLYFITPEMARWLSGAPQSAGKQSKPLKHRGREESEEQLPRSAEDTTSRSEERRVGKECRSR